MDKLKVGVVGTGVGRLHLDGFKELADDVEIVALCDVNESRLNEMADKYNISLRYTDYNVLFSSGKIDAVTIALPNSLHAPVSVAALKAGLHVLCEKPLAENVESGQEIVNAVADAPGKFMICFNRRYRPDVQWIKDMVDGGSLGRVYQVRAGWLRETGIPGWGGWFTNKQIAGGGPLIDLGVHILDMVMWLLGYPDPLTVSADVQTNFGPHGQKTWHKDNQIVEAYGVEDSATAFIRLADGISLTLETNWASHGKPNMDDIYITLLGTEGTIELYISNYASKDTLTFYTEINGVPVTTRPGIISADSDHFYAMAEFVKCIKEDTAPPASAENGLVIMQVIDAIYRSAEAGREVVME